MLSGIKVIIYKYAVQGTFGESVFLCLKVQLQ